MGRSLVAAIALALTTAGCATGNSPVSSDAASEAKRFAAELSRREPKLAGTGSGKIYNIATPIPSYVSPQNVGAVVRHLQSHFEGYKIKVLEGNRIYLELKESK